MLAHLARDPEPLVRWNIAWQLGVLGHSAALPALEQLGRDPHANVRFRVALAVAMIGDGAGLPILETLANDPYVIGDHAAVKAFAALALGKFGSESTFVLARLSEDADPVVRWHAAVALGEAGDARALPFLTVLLRDEVPLVRGHAGVALAQIGAAGALEELRAAATRERHEKMKGVLSDAVNTLARIAETEK
jgi:HEAT repeat protein